MTIQMTTKKENHPMAPCTEPALTSRPTVAAAEEILRLYFPVLDHGFVSLVDYMGGDDDIEQAARVAYGHGTRKTSETRALIRYLTRHKHTSPSEMVEFKFHCSMPIFVARQWIRHRTANVNEMSGRYSLMPMLFYTPPKDQLRLQSKDNKQGRSNANSFDVVTKQLAHERRETGRRFTVAHYEWLCGQDFARELARIDLPLSTYTQWYWKIDLHNLLHFLTLRVDSHAQWEIQQFGKVMAGMLKRVAPFAYEAWVDYEVCGVRFSRLEMDALRCLLQTGEEEAGSPVKTTSYVAGRSGQRMIDGALQINGLSERESEEFFAHFRGTGLPKEVPDFELDLSLAKTAEFFEEQAKSAAPKVG